MKYIKKYEKLNKSKVGDYVICKDFTNIIYKK